MTTKGKVKLLDAPIGNVGRGYGMNGLCRGVDGNFYSTTLDGSTYGHGSLYRVTPWGKATIVHAFALDDPIGYPGRAYVTSGADGLLYVVTTGGGTYDLGAISRVSLDGTATVLHNFAPDDAFGFDAQGPLMLAADGNFYGVTGSGGAGSGQGANGGVTYRLALDGGMEVIHTFGQPNVAQGDRPFGTLTQLADGGIYGMVLQGGQFNVGGYYRLEPKSAP